MSEKEARLETFYKVIESVNYRERRKLLKQYASSYPRFLYKFRRLQTAEDMDHLRGVIVRSEFWLSSPKNFNDPFDMGVKFVFDATVQERRERITKFLKDQGLKFHEIRRQIPKLMTKAMEQGLVENLREVVNETGVCSFGGDPRNILMWSHYASNHEGLCLVVEIAGDPKTFLAARPVEYSVEYPIVNWVKDFDEGKDTLHIVLRKHQGWEYEKERRIIKFKEANTLFKFRPEALRAIITGCRAKESTLENLKTLLAERAKAGMPAIVIYGCSQDESQYELVISKSSKF